MKLLHDLHGCCSIKQKTAIIHLRSYWLLIYTVCQQTIFYVWRRCPPPSPLILLNALHHVVDAQY